MSNFKDGKFKQKNPQRRAIRQSKFDEFDGQVGKVLATDPLALELDPATQIGIVEALSADAKAKHEDDTSGIEECEALVQNYALRFVPSPSDAARLGNDVVCIPNLLTYFIDADDSGHGGPA